MANLIRSDRFVDLLQVVTLRLLDNLSTAMPSLSTSSALRTICFRSNNARSIRREATGTRWTLHEEFEKASAICNLLFMVL